MRPPPPEDLHWGIAYLHEDIQDIRNEIRGVNSRIDERFDVTNQRLEEINRSLSGRLEETNRRLDSRFALTVTPMMALGGVLVAILKI